MNEDNQEKLDYLETCEKKKQVSCKHKFKPRYDEIYSTPLKDGVLSGATNVSCPAWMSVSYLKEKRYVHDVCVKCGKVIKK